VYWCRSGKEKTGTPKCTNANLKTGNNLHIGKSTTKYDTCCLQKYKSTFIYTLDFK
jgi:hypothetical protein